jgi:ABC-type uncharacterized transport system substrate-binding protein
MVPNALKGLEQGGFVEQENVTSVILDVTPITDPAEIAVKVKDVAPDLVISIVGIPPIINALKDVGIPTVVAIGVNPFVNEEGLPTANITGIYFTLQDQWYNSYKFLQKVAPLNVGQQAVFLDNRETSWVVPKEEVAAALQRLQIPLKAVVDATIFEDSQAAILNYNDDPEVGWILMGNPSAMKRDGSRVDITIDFLPWLREHLKKPSITHVERNVQRGILCGFGIDSNEVGVQAGKMAARVLQGEPIQSIKAEYPQKVSIALNRKTATKLGIVFSLDVLQLANVIYDDYEGKQVIRK